VAGDRDKTAAPGEPREGRGKMAHGGFGETAPNVLLIDFFNNIAPHWISGSTSIDAGCPLTEFCPTPNL